MPNCLLRCLATGLLAMGPVPAAAQEADFASLAQLIQGTWKIVDDDGNVVQDCDKMAAALPALN